MSRKQHAETGLPKRGMTYGPKLLLPFEEQNGRASFVLAYTNCDQQEPGTCGTTTRQCAACCVPPPPRFTGEAARVLLDLLFRDDAARPDA